MRVERGRKWRRIEKGKEPCCLLNPGLGCRQPSLSALTALEMVLALSGEPEQRGRKCEKRGT